jgi:hypothetical protein
VVHASNVGAVGVPADELEGGKELYGIDTVLPFTLHTKDNSINSREAGTTVLQNSGAE